jgi:hypothetical protein
MSPASCVGSVLTSCILGISVTSIPKRNNTLCLCIILSTTESKLAYTIVYNELLRAVCLVPIIKPWDDEDCVSCRISTAFFAYADVAAYVKSQDARTVNFRADGNVLQF